MRIDTYMVMRGLCPCCTLGVGYSHTACAGASGRI